MSTLTMAVIVGAIILLSLFMGFLIGSNHAAHKDTEISAGSWAYIHEHPDRHLTDLFVRLNCVNEDSCRMCARPWRHIDKINACYWREGIAKAEPHIKAKARRVGKTVGDILRKRDSV